MAPSGDSLRSQSPGCSENRLSTSRGGHWPPEAPLADQGWCSAQRIRILMIASGNHTIIHAVSCVPRKHETEGIRTSIFPGILNSRTLCNPSVMALRETAMPAPFAQGSRGAPAPVRLSMFLRRAGKLYHIHILRNDRLYPETPGMTGGDATPAPPSPWPLSEAPREKCPR